MKKLFSLIGVAALLVTATQAQISILTADGAAIIASKKPASGDAPSYANTGGTGNRTSIITVTVENLTPTGTLAQLIDGNTGTGTSDVFFGGVTLDGSQRLIFDFGSGHSAKITEITEYNDNSFGNGTWQVQGSNDGTTWTTIGSTFDFGGVSPYVISAPAANATFYRYYCLNGASGNVTPIPDYFEFQFKLSYR